MARWSSKGDVLFEIDPRPYQHAVDQATADRDAANARLSWATSQLERAEALEGFIVDVAGDAR